MSSSVRHIFLTCLGCLAIGLINSIAQSIYPSESPQLVPLWHRVADVSEKLRAVESCAFSPNGLRVASGGKFGYAVMMWRVADGHLLWTGTHESEVECVAFSPDGKLLATGGEDYYVRIWNVESGEQINQMETDSGVDGIAWSTAGSKLAAGTEKGEIWLWDAANFQLDRKIAAGSTVNSMQFSKDDQYLYVAGNIQEKDPASEATLYHGFARRIDLGNPTQVVSYAGHQASVKSIRVSPDESRVITGGFDRTARIFQAGSGTLLHTFQEPLRVEAVAVTPDQQYYVVGGHHRALRFYRTTDYQLALEWPMARVEYIDFSADGRLVCTGHEDSGLLSVYLLLSDTQARPGLYQRLSQEQLNNKDLKE